MHAVCGCMHCVNAYSVWMHTVYECMHCVYACTVWMHALCECMHCVYACTVWMHAVCECMQCLLLCKLIKIKTAHSYVSVEAIRSQRKRPSCILSNGSMVNVHDSSCRGSGLVPSTHAHPSTQAPPSTYHLQSLEVFLKCHHEKVGRSCLNRISD